MGGLAETERARSAAEGINEADIDRAVNDVRYGTKASGRFFLIRTSMTQIEAIQAEIESLSSEDFVRLREWIAQRDWQNWDRQIERDSAAGKLDYLREEVQAAKQQGELRGL